MKPVSIIIVVAFIMISCSSFLGQNGKIPDGPYTGYLGRDSLKAVGLIKQGGLQGHWQFYNPRGQLYADGYYRHGGPDSVDAQGLPVRGRIGKWTYYYANGNKQQVGSYKDDLMTGLWFFYNEDGSLDGKGSYVMGDGSNQGRTGIPRHGRHGGWNFFYEGGQLRDHYDYRHGKMNGKAISYYESGNIRTESFYVDGIQDSLDYGLYDSGKPWYRTQLKNGVRVGGQNEWYENGQARSSWTYVAGQPQGQQKAWHENGQARYIRTFDQGKESGATQAWYANGKIESSQHFVDGMKNGKSESWYENGQLKYTVDYIQGKIDGSIIIWAEDGKLSTDSFVKMETSQGIIIIDLYEAEAPHHAENFKKLATSNVYDSTYFHRVIPEFVVQGGDPLTRDNTDRSDDGTGGLGETIKAEIGRLHVRASIGAARDNNPEKASSDSQFYICLKDLPRLDNKYTVFGEVLLGMEVVDKIATFETDENDNPLQPIFITHTELGSSF